MIKNSGAEGRCESCRTGRKNLGKEGKFGRKSRMEWEAQRGGREIRTSLSLNYPLLSSFYLKRESWFLQHMCLSQSEVTVNIFITLILQNSWSQYFSID